MKNILIVGISQSGVFELASLVQENITKEKGYHMLGGYFDVFGDRYEADVATTDVQKSVEAYHEGAFKRSFALGAQSKIEEYRDYGLPGMGEKNAKEELRKRIENLKEANGPYIMTLTTWDLSQIKREAPELLQEIDNIIDSSDVIAVKLDNVKEAMASYVLAHETGYWVRGKRERPLVLKNKVVAKEQVLEQFSNEAKLLNNLLKRTPQSKQVTGLEIENGSQALQKVFGSKARYKASFGRPQYDQATKSYIKNFADLEKAASLLA